MVPEAAEDGHDTKTNCSSDPLTAASSATNLDWMRDPPPANMTVFQQFVRDVNWANSTLGPMAAWPRELKQMVRLIMADTSPCILYWGDKFTIVYNEAYVPLVGNKHPSMQGMDAHSVFPHFWDYFDKILTEQRFTGKAAVGESSMLLMRRHGYLEETYFDWKTVPVIGDDGQVLGSYGIPRDRTTEVLALRRADCIQNLTQQISKISNLEDLWSAIMSALGTNDKDIPFALLYSAEKQTSLAATPSKPNFRWLLQGTIGVSADHVVAKHYLDLQHDTMGFAPNILKVLEDKELLLIEATDTNFLESLDGIGWRGFGVPSLQFVIIPLKADEGTEALLIVGLNPYQRYSDVYRVFFQQVAEVVGPQISNIILSEEVLHRAEIARKATLEFQKSETRFTRFAERSIVGLAVAGVDGKILYANDAWYRHSGIDPMNKEFNGWIDTVYADDIPLIEGWWDRVLTEKVGGQFQFRTKLPFHQGNMHADHRTAICAAYPDLNEAGEVESVMGLVMDISELKYVESQLRLRTKSLEESERKYRNYAEHCPLGIARTDGQGYLQYGNDAWHNHYGFVRGQVRDPQPWLPHIHEDCLDAWKECYDSFQENPGPRAIELRLKDKLYIINDGDHVIQNGVYVLITGFSEFREDGTVDYIDFWVTDISAQKMAAKVLADKMEEAIRLKTQQERFIDMISHEIRNPLSAVLHCGEEIVETMKICLELLGTLPDARPHSVHGACTRLSGSIQNSLDAASTIMYCVQHQKQIVDDVLTLSKLDGDLLVVSPVPVQPVQLVRTSLKIFEPELKMTDITLSVVEDQSLSTLGIEWVLIDPNRFLQIVINLVTNAIKFTRTSPMRNINVTVCAFQESPAGAELGVQYVPRRYTPATPTSPKGDCYDEYDITGDVYLCFNVMDTGKGLTSEEQSLLFNRFAQASPRTHIEYGGSGLGLFISRQITEMLGGEIGMSSAPGSGCTFAFYVKASKTSPPRRPSTIAEPLLQLSATLGIKGAPPSFFDDAVAENKPSAKSLALMAPELEPEATLAGRHILVVEDNLVNQKVLCRLLRNRGFIVQAANHGLEALEAIRNLGETPQVSRFDVVLCDIEMPIMGGIPFAIQVRALESEGKTMTGHVPIIGVTANVRGQQVSAAIEAGMDGVTTKPYRIDDLVVHIERVCDQVKNGVVST